MIASAPGATSIRRRLLLFLLPPLTLLMLAGVYINYRTANIFVRAAYDQKLADIARALGAQLQLSADHAHSNPPALIAPAGVSFSITGSDGRLIAGKPRLSAAPPGSTALSYADARVDGRDLRLVTYRVPTPAGVTTITRSEERRVGKEC